MKPMGPSGRVLWMRVLVLVLAFGGILYFMGYLKKTPIGGILLNPAAAPGSVPEPTPKYVSLCPDRASEIVLKNQERRIRYFQQGGKWKVEGGANHTLEPQTMESWLKRYCRVSVGQFVGADEASAPVMDELTIKIDETERHLQRRANGVFSFDGDSMRSADLEAAYNELNRN